MNILPLFRCNSKIAVCKTDRKGYGVFALQDITQHELIELVPVLIIPARFDHEILQSHIGNYIFEWSEDNMAIALGFGSLYNHSFSPNAAYDLDYKNNVIEFVALRQINKGEEITVNYNGSTGDHLPVWFEVLD
jgi:uncharacterized protein